MRIKTNGCTDFPNKRYILVADNGYELTSPMDNYQMQDYLRRFFDQVENVQRIVISDYSVYLHDLPDDFLI